MKKIIFMAIAAISLLACSKEPGSLSGNIFYKYNDYVGNKPDAGAQIKLYNVDKGAEPAKYETTSDVQGNYKIEGVIPSDYLLFIKSKNTTAKATDVLDQLIANSNEVKAVFNFDVEKIRAKTEDLKAILIKETETYDLAMENLDATGDKYVKQYGVLIKEGKEKLNSILADIPKDLRTALNIDEGFGQKIEMKKVTIEEAKNAQNNTDFELTYK